MSPALRAFIEFLKVEIKKRRISPGRPPRTRNLTELRFVARRFAKEIIPLPVDRAAV